MLGSYMGRWVLLQEGGLYTYAGHVPDGNVEHARPSSKVCFSLGFVCVFDRPTTACCMLLLGCGTGHARDVENVLTQLHVGSTWYVKVVALSLDCDPCVLTFVTTRACISGAPLQPLRAWLWSLPAADSVFLYYTCRFAPICCVDE